MAQNATRLTKVTALVFMLSGIAWASAANLHLSLQGRLLTMQQGGKVLWARPIVGTATPKAVGGNVPMLGVLGRVAYAASCWSGAHTYCQTAGFDKLSGKALFVVQGIPKAIGQGQIITDRWSDPADLSFDVVEGWRIDGQTGQARRVNFAVPKRSGCGLPSYSESLNGRTTYDSRYAYAEQDDQCGTFVSRFDWHGSERQTPTVTSK